MITVAQRLRLARRRLESYYLSCVSHHVNGGRSNLVASASKHAIYQFFPPRGRVGSCERLQTKYHRKTMGLFNVGCRIENHSDPRKQAVIP